MSHLNLNSNYYDCNATDDIGMEPRLLEYIKKKEFFKNNKIDGSLLEKEFAITKNDMAKIKAYIKGDKKKYSINHTDIIDYSKAQFPSSEFKKDPRMERIKEKQKRETEASEQRHDYRIISKSFDMYRSDRPFASASGNDFSKSTFHPNDWFKSSRDEMVKEDMKNDYFDPNSFKTTNTYTSNTNIPNLKSKYNSYLDYNTQLDSKNHTIDDIIGKIDSYSNKSEFVEYRENPSNLNIQIKSQRDSENNYRAIPLMSNSNVTGYQNQHGIRDMDVDSYMRFGSTPIRGGKSIGYPSVMEHSFSYITPDIQDPNHVVMDRGIPSRAANKEIARPQYRRDPMR